MSLKEQWLLKLLAFAFIPLAGVFCVAMLALAFVGIWIAVPFAKFIETKDSIKMVPPWSKE